MILSFLTQVLGSWRGRLIGLALIGAIIGGPILVGRATAVPPPVPLRTAPVTRGSLTQTVAVSGSVTASSLIRLNFKQSGRLTEILVTVGDQVAKDQAIARLDPSDLLVAIASTQANLASAQARYDQVIAGATAEDVVIAQRQFEKVKANYATTKSAFLNSVLGAKLDIRAFSDRLPSSRDQVTTILGNLNGVAQPVATQQPPTATDPPEFTPEPTLGTAKTDARAAIVNLNQAQAAMENALTISSAQLAVAVGEWNGAYEGVRSGITAFDAAVSAGSDETHANTFYQAAQSTYTAAATKLSSAIDSVTAQVAVAQTNLLTAANSLQTGGSRNEINLNNARFNLAGAQTSFVNLQQTAATAKSKVTSAGTSLTTVTDAISGTYLATQASFQKQVAGPKSYEIQAALATIQASQAGLQTAQNNLDNATLRAPSPGTIASLSIQVGEFVGAGGTNNPFTVIANTSVMQLHGTIGEADVAKIAIGQVAIISVDAVGTVGKMTGRVVSIDPVATLQLGVPVYGVDTVVDIPSAGVRPGMSGTANVIIASRQNVITVPNLAIRAQGTRRFVQVLENGAAVDADVVFGISNETVTEVSSGLTDGQLVVLPAPRAAGSARPGGFPGAGGPPPGVVR